MYWNNTKVTSVAKVSVKNNDDELKRLNATIKRILCNEVDQKLQLVGFKSRKALRHKGFDIVF